MPSKEGNFHSPQVRKSPFLKPCYLDLLKYQNPCVWRANVFYSSRPYTQATQKPNRTTVGAFQRQQSKTKVGHIDLKGISFCMLFYHVFLNFKRFYLLDQGWLVLQIGPASSGWARTPQSVSNSIKNMCWITNFSFFLFSKVHMWYLLKGCSV